MHSHVWIEDKAGKYFKTICGSDAMSLDAEVRNMKRHLEAARKSPKAYSFLDLSSARVVVNGQPLESASESFTGSDDDLYKELMI